MKQPIAREVLDGILSRMDIADVSKATIRQSVAVTNELENVSGEKFVHLEIGVPGLKPSHIGVDAQKAALDRNVAAVYPNIAGEKPLKEAASRFIKAFIDADVPAECVIPTVGSMQGCFNLLLECKQMNPSKPGVLFIDPGFPAQKSQAKVLGVPSESFDVYHYRAEKLGPKLEEYLSKGNIGAILYSNPNNPSWVCLTDDELRTIGEMANRYDVVVLEDFAYLCMDFRSDLSKPFQPPYQVSVSRYTDNYIMMISASKIFSYAGERLGLVCFSPKMYHREYPRLRELYGMGRMGDNFVLTYLYAASSGTSHSAQYAMAAMMEAAVDGRLDFVSDVKEYGRRAAITKEMFERHGFHIVYDRDNNVPISDGFYYTVSYKDLTNQQLITNLLRCGIAAITLNTAGSDQAGIRACVSNLSTPDLFDKLDENLALFEKLVNE